MSDKPQVVVLRQSRRCGNRRKYLGPRLTVTCSVMMVMKVWRLICGAAGVRESAPAEAPTLAERLAKHMRCMPLQGPF